MFQSLCGQEVLENVFLTTAQWSNVKPVDGERRENKLRNGDFWGGLIRKGAALERFYGTRESGLELICKLKLKNPKPLDIQDQMVKQKMTLLETNAGQCINEELIAQEKKYTEKVEALEKERQEAIKAKDDEMNKILAAEQVKAQMKLAEAVAEKRLLAELHATEMKKREEEERKWQEDRKAKHDEMSRVLVAEQAKAQKKLEEEKRKWQEDKKAKDDEMNRLRAVEQAKAQKKLEEAVAEKKSLVEQHEAEMKKREAEERERQEGIRKLEEAVIAVDTSDIKITAHLAGLFGTYPTRGRRIFDINNPKEFSSDPFAINIDYRFNPLFGIQVCAKTLMELYSEGMGSTNYIVVEGVYYRCRSGTPIAMGDRQFVIFSRG